MAEMGSTRPPGLKSEYGGSGIRTHDGLHPSGFQFAGVRQSSPTFALFMSPGPFVRRRSLKFAIVRRGCRHGCRQPHSSSNSVGVANDTTLPNDRAQTLYDKPAEL